MHVPTDMEVFDGHCRFGPRGEVSLVEAVEMVTRAIAFCSDQKIPRLLVDVTGLTGFANPTLDDRFWMVQDWADEANGAVIVAMVARSEHIHPSKFGVKAAADAGLIGDVFTSEAEALEWLLKGTQSNAGPSAA